MTHKWHLPQTLSTSKTKTSQTLSKFIATFWRSHIVLNEKQPQLYCLLVSITPGFPQPYLRLHSSHWSLGRLPSWPLLHGSHCYFSTSLGFAMPYKPWAKELLLSTHPSLSDLLIIMATITCIPLLNVIHSSTCVHTMVITFENFHSWTRSPVFQTCLVKCPCCLHSVFSETFQTLQRAKTNS